MDNRGYHPIIFPSFSLGELKSKKTCKVSRKSDEVSNKSCGYKIWDGQTGKQLLWCEKDHKIDTVILKSACAAAKLSSHHFSDS